VFFDGGFLGPKRDEGVAAPHKNKAASQSIRDGGVAAPLEARSEQGRINPNTEMEEPQISQITHMVKRLSSLRSSEFHNVFSTE
jgi:hypothetical protein